MLKLEAKTNNEKIILDYLTQNASEVLKEKINNGNKTLSQCWSYIVSEAKKQAENGCACIEDATVFGWAVHFFEEDSIEAKQYEHIKPAVKTVTTTTPKKETPKKSKSAPLDQVSLFDM